MRQQRPEMSRYAIEFRDVSRQFVLHHEHRSSFQDWFIGLFRPRGHAEEFWALRNVSFGIQWGESFGLIGRNGAGKSTLLKLVTRILQPSEGSVHVNGRTYAMLELGAGFHPELSGRDNIFLNGSLYGFSRRDMREKYEDIVRFAELERFVDTPVKHFSSGMFARLGFGIAINMNPEILVIDEVLAVGDASFQEKCLAALSRLKEQGTTILFVSHEADLVRSFCDRAALIVDGQLADIGSASAVIDHYDKLLHSGEEQFRVLGVRALDEYRLPADRIRGGDPVMLEALIRAPNGRSTAGLMLEFQIERMGGTTLWSARGELPGELPPAERSTRRGEDAPDTRVARLGIEQLPIGAGQVRLISALYEPSGSLIDRQEGLIEITPAGQAQSGLLALRHQWDWDAPANPVLEPREAPARNR